jgi:urease accessory protein
VRANLNVMERDARAVRGERPFVLTNCFTGEGLDEVIHRISRVIHLHRSPSQAGAAAWPSGPR